MPNCLATLSCSFARLMYGKHQIFLVWVSFYLFARGMRVFYELSHKMSSMAKSSLQINECLIRNIVPLPFFPSSQHQLFVYSYSFLHINLFGSVSQLICCYPSCLSHPLPGGIRGRNRFLLPHVAIS